MLQTIRVPENIEVNIDFAGGLKRVGTLYRHRARGTEVVTFEYDAAWLDYPARFSLEPALSVGPGQFAPRAGALFGSISDSAPDTWGRRLMQRAERRRADREKRTVRTLMEADYLLGVSDVSRLGALRFRRAGQTQFEAPSNAGVPSLVELGRLLAASERILRDEENDEDLQMIFAPGSSLGGARPKASVVDNKGRLSIAKFPKENDEYNIELWEAVALNLAARAGIRTPQNELIIINEKPALLSRRFDRATEKRIPFLSALSMLGLRDGESSSYPELVDALAEHGSQATQDAHELFRRMTFNVLISNVDDHLRNQGFLWTGRDGWSLSPAYDLNPTPVDVRPRTLSTKISLEDATCDIELVLSVVEFFNLSQADARAIVREVADTTATWRAQAAALRARPTEIERMQSAFEHDDLKKALSLSS